MALLKKKITRDYVIREEHLPYEPGISLHRITAECKKTGRLYMLHKDPTFFASKEFFVETYNDYRVWLWQRVDSHLRLNNSPDGMQARDDLVKADFHENLRQARAIIQ